MHRILLVMRREIATALRRPSFYLAALIAPLTVGVIFYSFAFLRNESVDGDAQGTARVMPAGIVDRAGIIQGVPEDLQPAFVAYAREQAAADALRGGHIGSYFIIPPDYKQTRQVVRVAEHASFTSATAPDTRLLHSLLRLNLVDDPVLARRLDRPLELKTTVMEAPSIGSDQSDRGVREGLAFGLAMLLAFSIVNGSGWLVQAIAEEKENRTIEIVLTSLRPVELMAGKLLGLGTVALLQLAVWIVLSPALLSAVGFGSVSAATWAWTILIFLLGFLFIGGLMLACGAVGASMRESGQISGLLSLPVVLPLWVGSAIAENPTSVLTQALTFIPFTAPVTLIFRLVHGSLPLWQLLTSSAILVLAIVAAIWLAARLFRGTTLLTGARPTPSAIWRALRQA